MKKSIFYIIAIVLVLFSSCGKTALDRKAVLVDVKSLSFDKDTLWFGGKQDIMIQGLPDLVLSITQIDKGFVWKLNKPAYVKFNDTTQNTVKYDSTIRDIQIFGIDRIEKQKIDSILEYRFKDADKESFKYIHLSDILKIANNRRDNRLDSLKTLIAYTKNQKTIILLDTDVAVTKNNDSIIRFVSSDTIRKNFVKIQFFRPFHSEFLQKQKELSWFDKKILGKSLYFHWNDTCFTTSVKSFYTPFGANEITLTKWEKDTIKVSFNKIYRAAIPTQAVDSAYARNEQIPVSLRQVLYSNTYSNELYATNVANPNYWEFGTINPSEDYKFTIEQKSCLQNRGTESYVLSSGIFWKGLLPLLFIFFVGLTVICFITKKYEYISDSKNSDNDRWRCYFIVLYFVLFLLSIGRIFIGYNLSFTQPFSVYAFPTAVIVSPLILLCVLLFWIAFLSMEFGFDKILWNGNKTKRLFLLPAVILILLGIYFLVKYSLGQISTFYFLDIFNLSRANPFSDSSYVFSTTIWGLVFLSALLITFCMLGKIEVKKFWKWENINITKILIITMMLVFAVAFFRQQSSVSVALLLICLLLFWSLSYTKWLEIDLHQPFGKRIGKWGLLLIPLVIIGGIAFFRNDSGYFINLMLFPVIMSVVLFYQYHFYGYNYAQEIGKRARNKNIALSFGAVIIVVGIVFSIAWFNAKNYDPFSSNRLTERSVAYFDFSTIQEFGYRLSEERAQFFAELTKYAYPSDYDCYEPMHAGISSFIDPVIENDLSVPFGLIYQFGTKWWWLPIAFLVAIWGGVGFFVLRMSVYPKYEKSKGEKGRSGYSEQIYFSTYGIIRIFCISLILSSGLWLICSYYGVVPFTGRLIYGLGQDSIGEVFEVVFLFAFMGLCGMAKDNSILKKEENNKTTKINLKK